MEGGATWETLLGSTHPQGVAPLVIPHYPALSIGGVLSGAGVGVASVRHGLATDTAVELEVVTGEGELLSCSADVHADLFEAVRGGLGQCGIIVRARILVEPAPERLVEAVFTYDDLEAFFGAMGRAAAHPEVFGLLGTAGTDDAGKPACGLYVDLAAGPEAEAALASLAEALPPPTAELFSYELSYLEQIGLMAAVEERYRTTTDYWERLHPWFGVLLPAASAAGFLEEHLEAIVHADGRDRIGNTVVYVISGRPDPKGGAAAA